MSAFYLSKVGEAIADDQLRALYQSQMWPHDGARMSAMAADISALLKGAQQGNEADIEALAKLLGDALEGTGATDAPGIQSQQHTEIPDTMLQDDRSLARYFENSGGEGDDERLRELAVKLLNTQDSGALTYHYGSLPIMIGGQMMELDMVMFRERDAASSRRAQGMRKLVMTLKTETLGRVEIVAQSVDAVLSVAIGTQSPQATEMLAGHAQEVRDLAGRLGWKVDSVCYRLTSEPARAAQQLVRHVVDSGSLDAVV